MAFEEQRSVQAPPALRAIVSTVIFTLKAGQLQVCLSARHSPASLPETAVSASQSLEDAAKEQIFQLTGHADAYLQQLYTFDMDAHSGNTLTVAWFALIAADKLATAEHADANWVDVLDMPQLSPRHSDIISYALQRLRYKIEYSAVAFELLPEAFTLRELQDAYMIILNDFRLDKANFRKKIREAQILEEIDQYRETRGRPARLYRFRDDAQLETKARRFFP
jgi:8-oxo-dGTP diphosphatase